MNHQQMLAFFIRQTAKKVIVNEQIVDTIIRDQWKYANKASRNLIEVEIPEIGTFFPRINKLYNRLNRLTAKIIAVSRKIEDPNHPPALDATLAHAKEDYDNLKKKYDELVTKYMEEQGPNPRRFNK